MRKAVLSPVEENEKISTFASRMMISELRAKNLIARAEAIGFDYTTLQPGQKLPSSAKIAATKASVAAPTPIPVDAWETPALPPQTIAGPRRKQTVEAQMTTELVEINGGMIDATLSRRQKLALLAQAIKATGDNALDPIELVRAINAHTELAGDGDEGGNILELHLYLDNTAPTPAQLNAAVLPVVSKD